MEKIKLTTREMNEIVHDDHEDYEVIEDDVTGNWRHGTENTCIVQRISDKKFFGIEYRDSPKDSCMFEDMNDGGTFNEVVPKEQTIVVYVKAD